MNNNGYTYVSPEVALRITSAKAGFALQRAVGVFYRTSNNIWRIKFNIYQTIASGTNADFEIIGIKFAFTQAVAGSTNGSYMVNSCTNIGDGQILARAGANVTNYYASGDCELSEKPTYYLPQDL